LSTLDANAADVAAAVALHKRTGPASTGAATAVVAASKLELELEAQIES